MNNFKLIDFPQKFYQYTYLTASGSNGLAAGRRFFRLLLSVSFFFVFLD